MRTTTPRTPRHLRSRPSPARRRGVAAGLLAAATALAVLAAGPLGGAGLGAAGASTTTVRAINFPVDGTVRYTDTYGACRGVDCERRHQGQDLMGTKMQPLLAAVDGVVVRMGLDHALSGNWIVLRDAEGWTYHYVHLNNDTPGTDDGANPPGKVFGPGMKVGATVWQGQVVGFMGDSGNAEHTSPHLHFEIRDPKGNPINPYESLRQARNNRFVDVPAAVWFDEPVMWMSREGITTGVGGGDRFEPDRSVTRGELATFMWRAAGRPAASAPQFDDVPAGAFYADAVRWLRAEGLTTGVGGANRFEPDRSITRAEQVTLLHRQAGLPPAATPPFADVPPGAFYAAAVSWAIEAKLTTGVAGQPRFDPDGIVSRAQAATFLFRNQ